MIPYKDGLTLLENLDDADGKLMMNIQNCVYSYGLNSLFKILFIFTLFQ